MQTEWDEGHLWQQEEIEALIEPEGSGGITIQREGNAARALAQRTTITATYRSPFAVQTPLEAPAALADVQGDQVRVWVSTQFQERAKGQIAEALGVDANTVRVVPTYLGGGFGSKLDTRVAIEAARRSMSAGIAPRRCVMATCGRRPRTFSPARWTTQAGSSPSNTGREAAT
jgi:isoquinoline 1-oxidoreductase beta subunit